MDKKIEIVITSGYRWNYFEWFLLGFYMLEKQGKAVVKFKLPLTSTLLQKIKNEKVCHILDYFLKRRFEKDNYNMTGYMISPGGHKKFFAIDSADSPYLFCRELLEKSDIYFKMQYPKDINEDVFLLSDGICIPWTDHEHVNDKIKTLTTPGERKQLKDISKFRDKIKPLMIGPRRLSWSISYQSLMRGYKRYISDRKVAKTGRLMCYFGNAFGPREKKPGKAAPDFDSESCNMGYFGSKISHPNEKRAKVADYISKMKDCDARVISRAPADSGEGRDGNLIIPLPDFCAHIAKFQYNFNVSGYRKSIPNRFIESFMVGTGIVTDRLSVKWYQDFSPDEVIETIEMGYLPMEQIDWDTFAKDLCDLPESSPEKIIKSFEEKWRPDVVAEYIVRTVLEA